MSPQTFRMLNVSSKFAICGLPVRVDTYRSCSFGCSYCFANCRKIMAFDKSLRIGSMRGLEREYARAMGGGRPCSTCSYGAASRGTAAA